MDMQIDRDPRPSPEARKFAEEYREPECEKWRTVRSALDDWGRTVRMCAIYLTLNVPVGFLAWLIKH